MAMIAFTAGIGLFGCKPSDFGASAASGGEESEARSPTEELGRKNNPYVKCLNSYSESVHRGRKSWFEAFPKGPSAKQAKEDRLSGISKVDDPKECREGIAKAKAMKPSLPELEKAGDAYLAALAEVQPLTVKLHEYFEQGNYKDDKLALAIELHPKLLAAYEKFVPADRALSAEVDKLDDKINANALADIEKTDGKQLYWHHKRMLIEAKRFVTLIGDAKSPLDIDPAALQAAMTSLDTAATELLAYFTKNKEAIEKKMMSYGTWVESPTKEYVKAAKDLMRRNRDKKAFTKSEQDYINRNWPEQVEGHPSVVIKAYNTLITRTNGLRF